MEKKGVNSIGVKPVYFSAILLGLFVLKSAYLFSYTIKDLIKVLLYSINTYSFLFIQGWVLALF